MDDKSRYPNEEPTPSTAAPGLGVRAAGPTPASGPAFPEGRRSQRIGELSQRLGLTPRALRYWEERGLLPAARRTAGGLRIYGDEHVRASRGIQRLKQAGFTLEEIVSIQGAMRGSTTALSGMGTLATSLSAREAQIRERIREQQALLLELEAARRCVGLCDGCHGKRYDAECIRCLTDASGHAIPDCLSSLLEAAATRTNPA
jgi:MerR family transcriptional regulator, copper efflux regulator